MGDGKHVNLHPEAIKFREDLQRVFSSFEITTCGLTEKFVDFLKGKGKPTKFITVYKYLTETTPPAWMFPYLFEFLSQDPYSKSPAVWSFVQSWGRSVDQSINTIDEQVKKHKQSLLEEAGKMDKYL